jgi:hypothetical protein
LEACYLDNSVKATILDLFQGYHPATREELVKFSKQKLNVTQDTLIDAIIKLEKNGQINFPFSTSSQQPYSSFGSYLKKAAYEYWILVGLTLATAAIVLTVGDFAPLSYVRYGLGTLFVLGLPGFSLSKALWPNNKTKNVEAFGLDWPLRIAFSIVLSISIVSIVGILLDYSLVGVQLSTLVVALSFLTIFLGCIAVFREYKTLKPAVPTTQAKSQGNQIGDF